jgi:hypothetical protein
MNEFDDPAWIRHARALLDESTQALDAATRSRLNRARQAALAQRRSRWRGVGWLPAAGLACSGALLLGLAVWTTLRAPHDAMPVAPVAALPVAAAADALASDDSLEFYQDLEFYAWLDAEQDGDG